MRLSSASAVLALAVTFAPVSITYAQGACKRGTFISSRDTVPPNWAGPVFKLKQDYPETLPPAQNYPWLKVAFTENRLRDPGAYAAAVKSYVLEGNTRAGHEFVAQDNPLRKWYNIPWMDYGPAGNEFMHGLVHEIDRQGGWLSTQQTEDVSVWAITLVNDRAAFGIGQVWCDPENPQPARLNPAPNSVNSFPEGAVVTKALFFTMGPSQVPALKGSLEWDANVNQFAGVQSPACNDDGDFDPATQIHCPGQQTCNLGACFNGRQNSKVWLAQLDFAVRDSRASETGWVFGTWAYNSAWPGANWWNRLAPLGVTWGNDPGITAEMRAADPKLQLKETWINPKADPCPSGTGCTGIFGIGNHIGYAGRLDGPADEKVSACLSCHMAAGFMANTPPGGIPVAPALFPELVDPNMAAPRRMAWFNNVPAGVTWSSDMSVSLDYSLQLVLGIQHFYLSKATPEARKTFVNFVRRGRQLKP